MLLVARIGVALCALGTGLVAVLHVVPAGTEIDTVRQPLSEYALHESAWLFNVGVLALAAGSVAVTVAAATGGLVRAASTGGAGLILWTVGLAGVVTFPKHDWTIGTSAWGDVHRLASVVAFVSLPIAALALVARHRKAPLSWPLTIAGMGAVAALAFLGVIVGAVILEPFTGVRWWRAIPLGAVERVLATAEVVVILAVGAWTTKAVPARPPGNQPPPAEQPPPGKDLQSGKQAPSGMQPRSGKERRSGKEPPPGKEPRSGKDLQSGNQPPPAEQPPPGKDLQSGKQAPSGMQPRSGKEPPPGTEPRSGKQAPSAKSLQSRAASIEA